MTRTEIQQRFVDRFSKERPDTLVSDVDLDGAEKELGILFPTSFRQFLTTHGPVATPTILNLKVEQRKVVWDISWFFSPSECVESTKLYRSGGMREGLIAFATDCMGNVFCFDENDLLDARPDDAAIWFFDHDFCEDSLFADSFDAWLAIYLKLP